ncbi:MAG: DUF2288 domain-containing protein [Pseudomonadota bacterium]|nr:DUF2288 domain-containing protein [Pseudomonadota bacterium]
MQKPATEKLKNEIGTADWPLLKPHAERGVLLLIHPQLDLLEVAVQVAEDRAEQIRMWLDDGKITRPTPTQMEQWETGNTIFTCIIVQPFVLVQLPS